MTSQHSVLTLVRLNGFFLFFIHLRQELLPQFPILNGEKHRLLKIDLSQI